MNKLCCCCKKRGAKKRKKGEEWKGDELDKHEKANKLFDNAESMFFKELDVLNLIRTVRMAKVFSASMMTRRQKCLLRFQKHNLIDSDEEKSAMSSEDMLLKDLNHKKGAVRIFTAGGIQKRLMTYTEAS